MAEQGTRKVLETVGKAAHSVGEAARAALHEPVTTMKREWHKLEGELLKPVQSDAGRLRALGSLVGSTELDTSLHAGGGGGGGGSSGSSSSRDSFTPLGPGSPSSAAGAGVGTGLPQASPAPSTYDTSDTPLTSIPLGPGRSLKSLPIREQVWILMDNPSSSRAAQLIAAVIMLVIIMSCVAMIVQTLPEYVMSRSPAWSALEYTCLSVFCLELGLRLWSCPNKLRFLQSPLNIIDILAVLPVFLELMVSTTTGSSAIIRVIRLVRIFRVFKITRYLPWVRVFSNALWLSAQPLIMLLLLVLIAMVLFSSAIYYAERGDWDDAQGKWMSVDISGARVVSAYQSVPLSFWWCIVTMTTVGYGDMSPVTPTGRFIAALASMSGILVLAIPVSIISTNFNSEFSQLIRQKEQVKARMALLSKHFRENKTGLEAVLDEVEDLVTRNTQELQGELNTLFESARMELTEELKEIMRMAYERRRQLHLAALSAGQVQAFSTPQHPAQAVQAQAAAADPYQAQGAVAVGGAPAELS